WQWQRVTKRQGVRQGVMSEAHSESANRPGGEADGASAGPCGVRPVLIWQEPTAFEVPRRRAIQDGAGRDGGLQARPHVGIASTQAGAAVRWTRAINNRILR